MQLLLIIPAVLISYGLPFVAVKTLSLFGLRGNAPEKPYGVKGS